MRRDQAELVLAELLELAPAGVEEAEVGEGLIEYAVYGASGELPSLPDLRAAAGDALVEISTSETADDWQERWRQFHRPVLIDPPSQAGGDSAGRVPALHIRPPWELASPGGEGRVEEIVLDPGQAFGTGAHATTHMCLELLLELAAAGLAGAPVLDVGCGSGVLAIAAARLGFAPVLALDHEVESVEAARENAAVNRVEMTVERFDLRRQELPWPDPSAGDRAGVVVLANLLLPLLLELARTMKRAPAQLIASGLLVEQADQVAEAFAARFALRERRRLERGEWAALWLSAA
ncbi:MAG TPA: 50S ribosomal protein L11 methyltransferase [Solirubrobacteraceae bacterium]|nr:50S ribosomal protein L11 methyltransferase [Solirubrobacteraceae bacterium]